MQAVTQLLSNFPKVENKLICLLYASSSSCIVYQFVFLLLPNYLFHILMNENKHLNVYQMYIKCIRVSKIRDN